MKKCRSRNGKLEMEEWGEEAREKWRNGTGEINGDGEMEMEKWRWRHGDGEMETRTRKKWKPVRRRNGKPHLQEMKIVVYPVR